MHLHKSRFRKIKDCKKIISQTLKRFGTINSLINCAAYTGRVLFLHYTKRV